MKGGFRVLVVIVLSVILFLPASPASACCEDDDPWCWLAAAATGGLSCAVANLVNSIKDLIRDVNTLARTISTDIEKVKQAGVGGVQGAGDDLKKLAQQAEGEYADALRKAQSVRNQEEHPVVRVQPIGAGGLGAGSSAGAASASIAKTGGTASSAQSAGGLGAKSAAVAQLPPPPADPKALLDAMKRGEGHVSEQQSLVGNGAAEARKHADKARENAVNAADIAGKITIDLLLAPLTDLGAMLGDLITHPDRLFNPAALVDDQVKRITSAIDSELNKLADSITRESKPSLDMSTQKTKDTGDTSNAAKAIADQMEKLHKSRTKADLDRLNALLPRPNMTIAQHFAAPALGVNLAPRRDLATKALLKAGAGKTKSTQVSSTINSKLGTSWTDLKKKHQAVLHPVPVPGAEAKVNQKLDAMFRGLSNEQADAKKNELLAEARRRFGKDAKVLAKAQAIIGQQAQRSIQGGPVPAISR